MLLRVIVDVSFKPTDTTTPEELCKVIEPFLSKAVSAELTQDRSGLIQIEQCYHDEPTPTLPCKIIARWEVGKGKVI